MKLSIHKMEILASLLRAPGFVDELIKKLENKNVAGCVEMNKQNIENWKRPVKAIGADLIIGGGR